MSTAFVVTIPREIHEAVVKHARSAFPHECCGLLAGVLDGGVGVVQKCYPLVNVLASPVAYESEPRSLFLAFKDMRSRGLEVLAVYHSHPTSPAIPSRTDLAQNNWPEAVCLIVSLAGPEPEVRAWWLGESDFREAQWQVIDPSGR